MTESSIGWPRILSGSDMANRSAMTPVRLDYSLQCAIGSFSRHAGAHCDANVRSQLAITALLSTPSGITWILASPSVKTHLHAASGSSAQRSCQSWMSLASRIW